MHVAIKLDTLYIEEVIEMQGGELTELMSDEDRSEINLDRSEQIHTSQLQAVSLATSPRTSWHEG